MRTYSIKGYNVHHTRPMVRALVQAGKDAQAKVNERDRAGLDQRAVRRLGRHGLKLVKG